MSEIFLEVNGKKYRGWTDISVSKSLENMTGQFFFSTTVKENRSLVVQNDLKLQDEVSVFIDDTKVLTGFIEDLNIEYSADSHSISVSGRDKTADLIDSTIIAKQYKSNNFTTLVKNVLKDNNLSSIKVINETGQTLGLPEEQNGQTANSQAGQSIAEFLNQYAKKVQVLLTTNADGDLVITRESSTLSTGRLISSVASSNSNILSGRINLTTTERFRYITFTSQSSNNFQTESAIDQKGESEDSDIRSTRQKIIIMNTATESSTLKDLAKWSIALRKARGLRYDCTVQDFYANKKLNELWKPNTLVQVVDDTCQIQGQFLIQGVTYSRNLRTGSTTNLSIVNKGAFSLDALIAFNNEFAPKLQKKPESTETVSDILNSI